MGSEKRGEIKPAKITGLRVFAGIVILLIAAAVGGGLYLSGSPGTERAKQFDSRRLSDLQQIAGAVDSFYARTNQLPQNLAMLVSEGGQEGYLINSLKDPAGNGGYEYDLRGEADYVLCAEFDLPSEPLDRQGKMAVPVREPMPAATTVLVTGKGIMGRIRTWEHPAGHFCFSLNATDQIGSVLCGLQNPCQTGQTCAELPNNKGTRCVPSGWECAAAGCASECMLAESYPVKVTCDEPLPRPNDCRLMRNKSTGDINCFGCTKAGVCAYADNSWEEWVGPQKPGYVGIPYACFDGPKGCELAQ